MYPNRPGIYFFASLATWLVVALPGPAHRVTMQEPPVDWPPLRRIWLRGLASAGTLMCAYAFLTLALYQQDLAGKPWANHRRFGPEATWRVRPILKQGEHP